MNGRAIHTVFHVYNGRWDATDSVVQYAYGISFGNDPAKPSILRAERMTPGPRHDAILLANYGDVELVDCDFPIAVGVFADKGVEVSLDLPVNEPVTTVFDESVIPGCTYRAKLTRHTVSGQWFVFVRSIQPEGKAPPYKVVLNRCPKILPSVLSWNVKAELRIDRELNEPMIVGNTTIMRGETPPGITMWSFYGGGPEYDLIIRGSDVRIAEFMHRGGVAKVIGDADTNKTMNLGCTTLEMSSNANLHLENVHLGRPIQWGPANEIGEVNLQGDSRRTGKNCTAKNVSFHTKDQASVNIELTETTGKIESDGERIEITGQNK
jgi:hypothetical protein